MKRDSGILQQTFFHPDLFCYLHPIHFLRGRRSTLEIDRRLFLRPLAFLACLFLVPSCIPAAFAQKQTKDQIRIAGVQASLPERISYERVAQLLDGIFEDAAGIQVNALALSATVANSSSLDAVQQSVQAGVSANVLDALQNRANADLFKASTSAQVSLLNQQTALQPLLFDSTESASKTQAVLDSLKAQINPAAQDTDIAKAATDNLQAQATLKGTIRRHLQRVHFHSGKLLAVDPHCSYHHPQHQQTLAASSFSPNAPALTGGAAATNTATLPPTQQMDAQLRLLWDRLMRLLSTIGQPDSVSGQTLQLLRFYPSITYIDKKTTTLRLEYKLSCVGGTPTVLDVYPRTSPVNILSEKFKDNGFSLAAAFGFGFANASGAYNREHLKLTNSMSQASYVTGFGAQSDTFGWLLGKTYGDDTIATGEREFYALVAIPPTCNNTFDVHVNHVVWQGQNGNAFTRLDVPTKTQTASFLMTSSAVPNATAITMAYAPNDGSAAVPVSVTLNAPLDPQARVLVDGQVPLRARDGFARATPTVANITASASLKSSRKASP